MTDPVPRPGAVPRLLVLTSGDLWAGAAVQVFHTVRELHGTGAVAVEVATLNDGELRRRLEAAEIDVRVLPEATLGPLALRRRIHGLLQERRPDLLHLHDYKLQVLATAPAWRMRRRPGIVRTIHSRPTRPAGPARIRVELFHWLDRRCIARRTDAVVCVSDELRALVARFAPRVPAWTIPNGVPPAPARPEDRARARRRFDVRDGTLWIGTAIRLEAVKNPRLLLRLASELNDGRLDFALSVFGEGRERPALEREARASGLGARVRFHGHDDAVAEIMPGWDVFVLTSFHEGLPMSLLEAMAAGVPPVCTGVGGIPEVVRDGVDGLLAASDDAPGLARAVRSLATDEDLRRRLGQAARENAVRNHSSRATAERYLEVYRRVLAGSGAAAPRPAASVE